MTGLLDLPAEILIMIWQYSKCKSFTHEIIPHRDALSLTCRALSGFREYRPHFQLGDYSIRVHLCYLASHQHILQYITDMTLLVSPKMKQSCCHTSRNDRYCSHKKPFERRKALDDSLTRIFDSLEGWRHTADHETWFHTITQKCPQIAFPIEAATLLLLSPHLQALRVRAINRDDAEIVEYGRLERCLNLCPSIEFLPKRMWQHATLQNLKSLELDAFRICLDQDTGEFQDMKIERLRLTRCYVNGECWPDLFARFPVLNSLAIYAPRNIRYGEDWYERAGIETPSEIAESWLTSDLAALSSALYDLRHRWIDLDLMLENGPFELSSFAQFVNLENLCIDWSYWLGTTDWYKRHSPAQNTAFLQRLPPSLRVLTIYVHPYLESDRKALLENLIQQAETALPRLEKIVLLKGNQMAASATGILEQARFRSIRYRISDYWAFEGMSIPS